MEEKNTDRRIRKTKKLFRQGLVQLMSEKKPNQITVRELCDLADVNRGTFYLHYRDIFDLLEQIENEMFSEFYNALNKYKISELPSESIKHFDERELNLKPLPLFYEAFQFVAENADMCRVLLGDKGDIAFVEKLKGVVRNKIISALSALFKASFGENGSNAELYEYYYNFMVSGCIGIIQHWLDTGMKESAENMALFAKHLVIDGVSSMLKAGGLSK